MIKLITTNWAITHKQDCREQAKKALARAKEREVKK